jgi:hypothetical protein
MIRSAKGNQGLGKWEAAARMERLVRELAERLDEAGLLEPGDDDQIMNAVYEFRATLPRKVQDDLLHG